MLAKYHHDVLPHAIVKTMVDGRTAVYVWGAVGRGYIVSPPVLERLRSTNRFFGIAICLAVIAGAFLFGWTGAAAGFVLTIAVYNLTIWRVVQDIERTADRLTKIEVCRAWARAYPPWMACLASAGAVLMIGIGTWLLWTFGAVTAVVACPMILFGTGVLVILRFWLILRRQMDCI